MYKNFGYNAILIINKNNIEIIKNLLVILGGLNDTCRITRNTR
jgi:hypothetical protein